MVEGIQKVGVIGSGTMGLGIAQIMAMQGIETILYDVREEALETADATIKKQLETAVEKGKLSISDKDTALSCLKFSSTFSDLQADLFIEAIVEQLDAKVKLFCALASQNKPDVILATNTSTIPISRIASGVPNPERVVGMHFFNPAHLMKLVEVVGGAATSEIVIQRTVNLAVACGKSPIKCTDAPGFIVNRVARPYYLESLKMLEEGGVSCSEIDSLMEGIGFKMGPFKLMDLIGVDVNHKNSISVWEQFMLEPRFKPSRFQQQLVDAGFYGRKTGRGFYEYQ